MSEDRFSLGEYSQFFNNVDDSDGHRLAEFLQKKKGVSSKRRRVLMDFQPDRFSLNVKVDKLENQLENRALLTQTKSTPAESTPTEFTPAEFIPAESNPADSNPKEFTPAESTPAETEVHKTTMLQEKQATEVLTNKTLELIEEAKESWPDENIEQHTVLHEVPVPLALSPKLSTASSSRSISTGRSPNLRLSSLRSSSLRSPSLRSPIHKSGGAGADKLRRYSLKRLSTISHSRRLLTEFESTVATSDFTPNIYSTPKGLISAKAAQPVEAGVGDITSSATVDSVDNQANVMLNLQKKDKELQVMLKDVVESTIKDAYARENLRSFQSKVQPAESPPVRGRSYTVEKGTVPGQVILTPSQLSRAPINNTKKTNLNMSGLNCLKDNTTKKLVASSEVANILASNFSKNSLHKTHNTVEELSRNTEHAANERQNILIPDTPTKQQSVAADAAMPDEDINIPAETEKLVQSLSKAQIPLVFIPVHQTFNGSCRTPATSTNADANLTKTTVGNAGNDHPMTHNNNATYVNKESAAATNKTATRAMQQMEIAENELSIANLLSLSDDSDNDDVEDVKNRRHLENSDVPLNLMSSKVQTRRTRKLHKRKKRPPSQAQLSETNSTETDTDTAAPKAHPLNLRRSIYRERSNTRRVVALNKAPRSPINGEKFAPELKMHLARLTNYEIIDLRKRNSLGRIYPISGRKTSPEKRKIYEKRLELEDGIQTEILKRMLEGTDDGILEHDMVEVVQNNVTAAEAATPATTTTISAAKDSTELHADVLDQLTEGTGNSSLVGESSIDRISFVPPASALKSPHNNSRRAKAARKKAQEMPEHVKNYVNATKNVKRHSEINKSKRSLYTKGHSDTEDLANSSLERIATRQSNARANITTVPSPPSISYTDASNIQVISPPPSTSMSLLQQSALQPPQLFSDHERQPSSLKAVNQTITPLAAPDTTSANTEDELIFKKPHKPAPRYRARKRLLVSDDDNDDDGARSRSPCLSTNNDLNTMRTTTDSSVNEPNGLRRSKRGHVPLKNNWSFRTTDPTPLYVVMLREQMEKKYRQADLKKKREKEKSKALNSSNAESTLQESTIQPVASSTANSHKDAASSVKQKRGRFKQPQHDEAVNEQAIRRSLSPIYEPIVELDEEAGELPEAVAKTYKTSKVRTKTSKRRKTKQQNDEEPLSASPTTNSTEKDSSEEHANNTTVIKRTNVRVRLQRMHITADGPSTSTTMMTKERVSYTNSSTNTEVTENVPTSSGINFVDFLKGLSNQKQESLSTERTPHNMVCSISEDLVFTQLEDIDYAFYETSQKGSLGYLRFQPEQMKPLKRTKKYSLRFVVICGEFEIICNDDAATFKMGDMIDINKGSHYSIENITNELAILMVIKM